MPRELSDAAKGAIVRQHSPPHNLIYMDIEDNRLFLAVDSVQDIAFQRTVGPLTDASAVTWEHIGGAMIPGTAEETSDLDGQGQEVSFAAVDPNFALGAILLTKHSFNRDYQHWRVHIHEVGPNAGQVKASYLLMHGKMNGAFRIDDQVPEDLGVPPGTIIVRFRVTSPLAMLDVRRSIQTNLRSHQKWYPGDLGMEYVQAMQNHRIFWGVEKPDEAP